MLTFVLGGRTWITCCLAISSWRKESRSRSNMTSSGSRNLNWIRHEHPRRPPTIEDRQARSAEVWLPCWRRLCDLCAFTLVAAQGCLPVFRMGVRDDDCVLGGPDAGVVRASRHSCAGGFLV